MRAWSREENEKFLFVKEALSVAVLLLSDRETVDKVSSQGYYYLGKRAIVDSCGGG